MRLLAVAVALTLAGVVVAGSVPELYLGAPAVCWLTVALLAHANRRTAGRIASLRHALLAAVSSAAAASVVSVLILLGDLPLETRQMLRVIILGVVALPPLYWLMLLIAGGFRRDD